MCVGVYVFMCACVCVFVCLCVCAHGSGRVVTQSGLCSVQLALVLAAGAVDPELGKAEDYSGIY